jgi:phosphomannomutase
MSALPTRDAVLPILCALIAARDAPLSGIVKALPSRFTFSDRITPFPPEASAAVFSKLLAGDCREQLGRLNELFGEISGTPVGIDLTDGMRVIFANEEIIHFRGSGNAPELRCYTEADSRDRAEHINVNAKSVVNDFSNDHTSTTLAECDFGRRRRAAASRTLERW